MRKPTEVASFLHNCLNPRAGRRQSLPLVWLGAAVWTLLAGATIWWLLHGPKGPSLQILHAASPGPQGAGQRVQAFVTTDVGLQRVIPWILLGPYVALAAWCFPLERGRLPSSLVLNLLACAAFLGACLVIDARTGTMFTTVTVIRSEATPGNKTAQAISGVDLYSSKLPLKHVPPLPQIGAPSRPLGLLSPGIWAILLDLLAYGAIVSLTHSVHFYRRYRERESRALFLETNLARARLDTLRAQLQPHFLFNSLNAVAALLRRDPRQAEVTLMSLSELLRLALNQSERQEVALREEMEFVRHYLEIQQTRFGDKLRVEQKIDPESLDCRVPALLLQPLVENAIRHGIEPTEKAGVVRLTANRRDGKLVLTVEDNGVGLAGTTPNSSDPKGMTRIGNTPTIESPLIARAPDGDLAKSGAGIGLSNLQARLETLYGPDQSVEFQPRPGGGLVVALQLPWCRAPAETLPSPQAE